MRAGPGGGRAPPGDEFLLHLADRPVVIPCVGSFTGGGISGRWARRCGESLVWACDRALCDRPGTPLSRAHHLREYGGELAGGALPRELRGARTTAGRELATNRVVDCDADQAVGDLVYRQGIAEQRCIAARLAETGDVGREHRDSPVQRVEGRESKPLVQRHVDKGVRTPVILVQSLITDVSEKGGAGGWGQLPAPARKDGTL